MWWNWNCPLSLDANPERKAPCTHRLMLIKSNYAGPHRYLNRVHDFPIPMIWTTRQKENRTKRPCWFGACQTVVVQWWPAISMIKKSKQTMTWRKWKYSLPSLVETEKSMHALVPLPVPPLIHQVGKIMTTNPPHGISIISRARCGATKEQSWDPRDKFWYIFCGTSHAFNLLEHSTPDTTDLIMDSCG